MRARLRPLRPGLTAGSSGGGSDRPQVVAGAYPFAWLVEQVGGPDVDVTNLVKARAEPHDVELSPRQVGQTQEADLVVHLKGFQAAVDDAVKDNGLDLSGVMKEEGRDPHVWLDPRRMELAATAIASELAALDPEHATEYQARSRVLDDQLRRLDLAFTEQLRGCARKEVVTSHAAFGYLAQAYGLEQKGISGFEPDAEPSPADVADVARYAREHKVTTIFFETRVDPKVAETVADEVGARTAVLDPVESVADGDDYLTVMRRNATALHDALGCA